MYSIYKTVNKITGKFYIGKQHKNLKYYLGSGNLLKKAIDKHGKENFTKTIIEDSLTAEQAAIREQYWIEETGALSNQGYNMNAGGIGGDNSRYIDYEKRGNKTDNFAGRQRWWSSLSKKEQKELFRRQGMTRSKVWYISKVNSKKEIKVTNLHEWCKKHNIRTELASTMATIGNRLYAKQTRGYRFRREGDPKLPPYENRRHIATDNGCKGKTWRLEAGRRVWYSK